MNLNGDRINKIYEHIKKYIKYHIKYDIPEIILYSSQEAFDKSNANIGKGYIVYACFNKSTKLIHVILENLYSLNDNDIYKVLLHEIYHYLVVVENKKNKTDEEILADKFANYWVKKIISKNNKFGGWDEEQIKYLKNNYSWKQKEEIVNFLNKKWSNIRNKANKLQLKRINQSKYWCDHFCFSPPFNNEIMWVAGFIAADGCIRKNSNNIKIDISKRDIEILYKIKKIIKYNGNIKEYLRNGKKYAVMSFSSKQIVSDLNKYFNIISNKSLSYCPPDNIIKSQKFSHFLRGYSDGDGSFHIHKKNNSYHLRFSLIGSKVFLEKILIWMEDKNIKSVKIQKNKNCNIYTIKFGGNTKVSKIHDIIYHEAYENILLKRKFDIIKSDLIKDTINKKFKSVIRINPHTGEKKEFKSITEAVLFGYTHSGIYDACNGRSKTHRGFKWKYKE